MSKESSTRDASIELRIHDGEVQVYFNDAQVAQWDESYGSISDPDIDRDDVRKVLAVWLRDEISDAAGELAESLVKDLFERVLPDNVPETHPDQMELPLVHGDLADKQNQEASQGGALA